ncbi:MAG: hypothetical protein J5787_03080 [Alphaproteobacteria bacterium]|nr:hypothetical protein [Alphaproteobacteria bacterium]
MKREELLKEIAQAIQAEELHENDVLADLDEWDSLAETTALLTFGKALNLFPDIQKIRDCKTVADLLDIGNEKFE